MNYKYLSSSYKKNIIQKRLLVSLKLELGVPIYRPYKMRTIDRKWAGIWQWFLIRRRLDIGEKKTDMIKGKINNMIKSMIKYLNNTELVNIGVNSDKATTSH